MTYFLWDKPTEVDRPDNTRYGMPTYVYSYGDQEFIQRTEMAGMIIKTLSEQLKWVT